MGDGMGGKMTPRGREHGARKQGTLRDGGRGEDLSLLAVS